MEFDIKINNYGNDAMKAYPELETSRILKEIAIKIENGRTFGACMDINGNKIGDWGFTFDDEN